VDVDDDDGGALGGERPRRRGPDAGGAAGHDGDAVREAPRHRVLLSTADAGAKRRARVPRAHHPRQASASTPRPRSTTAVELPASPRSTPRSFVPQYTTGRFANALATEVSTAATAAVSGVIRRATTRAAAVAVVLALLTTPPTALRSRKPRPPKYRCTSVPADAITRKITAKPSTRPSDTGEDRPSWRVRIRARSARSHTQAETASAMVASGGAARRTAAGAKMARMRRLRANMATTVTSSTGTARLAVPDFPSKARVSSAVAAVLFTRPPRKAA